MTAAHFFLTIALQFMSLCFAFGNGCESIFLAKDATIRQQFIISQWLRDEQESNYYLFRQSSDTIMLSMSVVPRGAVQVSSLGGHDSLLSLFARSDSFLWPKHPYNTSDKAPFSYLFDEKSNLVVSYTASSSLVFFHEGKMYSIKIPTNSPFQKRSVIQESKVDRSYEVKMALPKSEVILEQTKRLGVPEHIMFLYDILVFSESASGNGIILRDLTPMQDGNRYFPLFSIPYRGKEIAEQMGKDFKVMWGEVFEGVGASKAEYLLKYGVLHETPNPQNFIIQLDLSNRQIGKIVYRDNVDANFYEPVARNIGLAEKLKDFKDLGETPVSAITDNWRTVFKWFYPHNQAVNLGVNQIPSSVLTNWKRRHDQGFLKEIERLLQVTIPEGSFVNSDGNGNSVSYFAIDRYLKSEEGQKAIQNFYIRMADVNRGTY